MSQRGKRGNHLHHPRLDVEPQPPPTKRRKGRPPNGGGGGLGGGLGGGGGSGGGPGNNINFPGNPVNVNCVRPIITSSVTSVDLEPNQQAAVGGEDIISSTSAKAAGSQGSSSSVATWQARSVSDIKMSSIYNRSSTEAPAELYRKDLISAMKLPDSEQLANYEYLVVNDQWKQEWERGVQVPVNPDSLPEPYVEVLTEPIVPPAHDFKLPKNRFLRITKDENYSPELHCLTNVVALAENSCAYDIDRVDSSWLHLYNTDRKQYGAFSISETQFERVIEELEIRCWEQIQVILKNEEGLGIEYDENVICDVCRSPDSEEANEMVFCDNCNICVHQACYGITAIPSGQWLCRTCSMGIKPDCVLCPNKGGAMKSTKSGKHWAHVSCALWIPEVSIGCVDRMEPITKISSIPTSRWALLCVLCRGRDGACIQCSVKTCKTAYHVTCAFQHGLEMRAIIEEGNAEDGVKLRSYCHKHSVSKGKKEAINKGVSSTSCKNRLAAGIGSGTEDDDCRRRKSRKSDMTSEERNQVRARRLQEVESEFDKHVNIKDISCHLFDVDDDAVEAIYNYWKLKRKSRNNRALIPPKSEDVEMIARKQEQQDLENHKLVVHLRQDLERVRNLCYMVSRREKLSRSLFKLREQVFYKQISVLTDANTQPSDANEKSDEQFKNAVIYANDGPTLYDRFYSSCDINTPTQYQSLEFILEKLLGSAKSGPKSGTKASRASTSTTKRATTKASTNSASTSANSTSCTAGKASTSANKKVNNGGVISSKTTALISSSTENAEKQMAKKITNRRSAPTATPSTLTTPTSGQRTSTGRTPSSKTTTASAKTKNAPNSSDDSSSSSGSSSSDDEDSSSDNGSSSGSGSSSATESASSSSDSDSSSLSGNKVTSSRANKSLKKLSPSKKKANSRSLEVGAKQRRKSITQSKAETEINKTSTTKSTKNFPKVDITTVLSSSSEIEAEANKNKKQKVSVPVKQSSNNTSETEAGVNKATTSQSTSNLLLSQSETNKTSLTKENSSSSSDESIEVTPKKCRKQLTKSMDSGNKDYITRKKVTESSVNRKLIEQIYSDSDSSLELDNKEKEERAAESNVSDSQNQQTIRTKAAMKEFTLQQQTCSKTQKDLSTSGNLEKLKEIQSNSHKISNDIVQQKPQKLSSDLLVVPQRQAAKKASENMRSTNSNILTGMGSSSSFTNTSNTGTLQRDVEVRHREATKQKDGANVKSDDKVEKKSSTIKSNDQQVEKPTINKRGRPPKIIKEAAEPSQISSATTSEQTAGPSRAKEPQTSMDQETKKAASTTAQTSDDKLAHSRTSATLESSKSNENTKNNILVAYVVPQRQAAKKAAEQLKNNNKTPQANPEAAVTATYVADDKERVNSIEKETKLKTPEDRSAKAAPTRRMSTREATSNLSSKQDVPVATMTAKKTPTSSRQRVKDEPPIQTTINTTPKRPTQSLDKKRKASITSSSESDSSSSSSSSDGSDDSSSNSGSSYSSSSSDDEDASDVEGKRLEERSVSDATKQNVRKSVDSRNMVSQQISSSDNKISSKLPSQKQLKRNVSNSSSNIDEQSPNKSSIQTRRKSSQVEEPVQKTPEIKTTSDSQAEDNSTSMPQPSSPSPVAMPITQNKKSDEQDEEPKNEIKEVDFNYTNKFQDSQVGSEKEAVCEKTTSSIHITDEISNAPEDESFEIKNPVTTSDLEEIIKDNINSNEERRMNNDDNIVERIENKEILVANSNSDVTLIEDKPTSLVSVDLCSEVPMDIDEELTTAPTHTSLPSGDHNSSLLKTDDILVNLDPPPAPVPASPIPSSSSSCEENDDQSNVSNDDQENLDSTHTTKSRRTIPGSPPISAEEEHTHHTQHLLNEMELVRALEEERKKDLAAANAEEIKFGESKSPGVAVIAPEPLEIIDLDSNSNSEHMASPQKQPLDVPTTLELNTAPLEISPLSFGKSSQMESNKNQQNIDSLEQETKLQSSLSLSRTSPSTTKVSCDPLPISTHTSTLESAHHPIVDTILDLEDNAKKKREENQQQQMHSFPNVLLNTSPFGSHSVGHVLDPHSENLNNLLTNDSNIRKDISEEDSFQATRNLLEKLRKKRNRADEPKEPDLMLPPPTPAIPSVFPFHNAADPEDIIHAQKENAMSSLEANSAGHYNIESTQPTQTTTPQTHNSHNLLVSSSPNTAAVPNKDNNLDIYGNMSHNSSADSARTSADADNICSMSNTLSLSTYIEGNGQSMQTQPQLPISPMQQHSAQHTPTPHHPHQGTTPNSNYTQQQQPHTPAQQTNVADLTSLIQNELASQAASSSLSKTPTIDAFGSKQNNNTMSSNDVSGDRVSGTTPDFVDLHAAAAASSASIGSNKLVVDCDFDENTRMQSPYTMQANRIWNENDLIAARRSTSPSSVSESNDQSPSIDLQPQQQQQTPVQHQIPLQNTHVQSQHTIAPNVLNNSSSASNSNAINKNSFFSSINNFALTSSFQQHPLQTQNQLNQQTQQQSSLPNGIDSMIYNQSYNSSTATTPTSQGTPQQQQSNVQQQSRTQQYNGSVGLFHDAASNLPNINQIPFVSNDGSSGTGASVMYPAGPGIGNNVNAGSNSGNQQQYNSNSAIGSTNTSGVQYSGAAFTSSTHNIALTAAIVGVSASGSLIDHNSPRHHQLRFNLTSPNNANTATSFNSMHLGSCAESMMANTQPTSHHTTPTKDSPSKANRSSSRYSQQTQQQQQLRSSHKSPQVTQHKSPGKSPRQMELLSKQLQQQAHTSLTEFTNLGTKPTKYDPLTHTLAGKPRQRAPRGTGSGSRGRGRGRGRNRGGSVPNALIPLPIPMSEYVSADNLVGTPFEFSYEEEMAAPGMENLQSLRDRRRSFDCRNAQNTEGLKYRSPSYNAGACKVRHNAAGSTSVTVPASASSTESIVNCNNNIKGSTTTNLHSIVQPMLPGPVDMRTYNLGFEPQHSSASQEAYNNNLLGAFDSGTADQTLSEFDEEDEREFQSALRATGTTSSITTAKQLQISLSSSINTSSMGTANAADSVASANNSLIQTYSETMASTTVAGISNAQSSATSMSVAATTKTCQSTNITTAMSSAELVTDLQTSMETTSEDVSIDSDTTLTTKASLSDSRNQLKLKIKGPLAYPDSYHNSNVITHASTSVQSNISSVQSMASTNATISASVSGSGTNSRRMRKKELLSLYVVQKDNHGDDSSCGLPPADSNLLSNVMSETIRKTESVCSEVDEYGSEFTAGSTSSKRFKKNSSRELRSLDIMVADMNDMTAVNLGADGRRRSGCSSGSAENIVAKIGAASSAGKRRGRSKTLEGAEDEPAPKLKIKIRGLAEGNASATATVGSCESSFNNYEVARRSVACPPKKRLTSNYTPTLEDLMRDSMNYRDQVMQEFGGDDDERTKRTSSTFNTTASKALVDPPTHQKKMKSSKSKKEKKDKKRHKNKDFDDNMSSISGANNSMITTLIEQPTSASPGEPPKLILRINKRKAESTATDTSRSSPATANTALSPEGPSAPIRLKLARVAEGGGYVIGDKKRKKGKKSNSIANTEDLANANSNTSCSNAVITPVSINELEKFTEDANARLGMATSPAATFTNYTGGDVGVGEPPSMAETDADAAKDSSTPSPCLVIDSSKSNDIHDSSNTASSLNDISAPCISESIHSLAVTPTAVTMVARNCNDNSNSQSSALSSSHSRLSNSNSNSLMSATHQSQASTGNSSTTTNQNNLTNTNNSSSNSNSGTGSSSILGLQKNCEVR